MDITLNKCHIFRMIEKYNIASSEDFRREYLQRQNQMEGLVGSHVDSQSKFCDTLRVSTKFKFLNNYFTYV